MANAIRNTTADVQATNGSGHFLEQAVTGRAIERMEAAGQAQLCVSDVLPMEMRPSREAYERLGFVFGAPVDGDPLFVHATLPAGWSKAPTDHSMWSKILDAKGRPRVEIFYKAAFYDRRADMRFASRYEIKIETRGENFEDDRWQLTDRATNTVLLTGVGRADIARWLESNVPHHTDSEMCWAGVE
jgi:hypothetical protein